MSKPFATAAREALQRAVKDAYGLAHQGGVGFHRAAAEVAKADDILATMAQAISAITAAEELAEAADMAVKSMRAALAEQLAETGAEKVSNGYHTAYLSKRPASVAITEPAAIPREYWVQPPPAPDKRAIMRAINDGVDVPGAEKVVPNEPLLVIKSRQKD